MSATSMTIDYELTKEQFLQQWRKELFGLRRSPLSWIASAAGIWFALDNLGQGPWWMTATSLIVATHLWWTPRLLMQSFTTMLFWSRSAVQMRIEVDNSSMIVHRPDGAHAPQVFRWSDFRKMSETNVGIEFKFNGSFYGTVVPWIAFQDAEQQTEFMRIVNLNVSSIQFS